MVYILERSTAVPCRESCFFLKWIGLRRKQSRGEEVVSGGTSQVHLKTWTLQRTLITAMVDNVRARDDEVEDVAESTWVSTVSKDGSGTEDITNRLRKNRGCFLNLTRH